MSFRAGGEDTKTLKREFATILPASHLQDLPEYKAYVRTMNSDAAGGPSQPIGSYILNTFPPSSTDEAAKEKLHVVALPQLRTGNRSRPAAGTYSTSQTVLGTRH
jgi:hypothetical protein